MRKSRALAAVLGAALTLGVTVAGQAAAEPAAPNIIGGGTVGSAPWGAGV